MRPDDPPARTSGGRLHPAFGEWKTLHAWSRDVRCRVSRQGLYHRVLALGLSVEEAFRLGRYRRGRVSVAGKRIGRRKKTVTAWGRTLTVIEWAAQPEAVVSAAVILHRLGRGYRPEDAIGLPPHRHRQHPNRAGGVDPDAVTAWGETRSVYDWAADPRCPVNPLTVLARLNKGYSPEEAVGLPLHRHRLYPEGRAAVSRPSAGPAPAAPPPAGGC